MIQSEQATELGSPAPAAADAPASRSTARIVAIELGYAAIAGLLALAVALWSLRVWDANLSVPFRYSVVDDTKFYLMLIKGILDHGWFLTNHSLGAPFGQQLYDYPQGADNLNLFMVKVIGLISPHPGVVINVFLFVTFVLDAAAACLVARRLGVSPATSIVCAVLFALLPYHFFRSDSHLFLSSYWSLPFTAYLFIAVIDDRPLFAPRAAGGRARWLSPTTIATVVMCVVIASTGLYYAVFGLILIAAALLLKLLVSRRWRALVPGVAALALVGVVLVANLSPTFVYHARHGGNTAEVHSAGQGDDFAMSASDLVLPPLHDRIAPLRHVTEHYANATPPHGYCEQCYESVGTIGDVGLVWLLVIAFGSLAGAAFVARLARVHRWSALGVAVVLAVAVTGGLSSLTRVFVSNDIRAWNRMSVLIAFFALLSVGLLLDRLLALIRRRVARRPRLARLGPWPGLVLLAAVLAFGIADQTSPFFVPNFTRDAAEYHSDGRFDAAIERTLPKGAEVMELPFVPYPEGYQPYMAPGQTLPFSEVTNFEYELGRPYIQSHGLSWSYGAMKGRATDWSAQLAAKPLDLSVIGAAAAGFDGLTVEPAGYPGAEPQLRAALRRLLHAAPRASADGSLWFYDLRPLARRLRATHSAVQLAALRDAVLRPLRLTCTPGRLTVTNPSSSAASATVTARLAGGPAGATALTVNGRSVAVGVRRRLRVPVTLAPGATTLRLAAGASSPKLRLVAPTVVDDAFDPFARGAGFPITGIVGPPCKSVGVG
jgi:phosphoglycerol transferase